jgi:hypothetical protein
LQEVAADRRHVAHLGGGGSEECLGNQRKGLAHAGVIGHIAHPGAGAEAERTIGPDLDPIVEHTDAEGDETLRAADLLLQ